MDQLAGVDPRRVQVVSPAGLFERQQERLPPVLLAEGWMAYDEMPWAAPFSLQTQLKRAADLLVAASLLLFTSPLMLLAMGLIWLDDPGPVFYLQQRSGWMGNPFTVLKLRTMRLPDVFQDQDSPQAQYDAAGLNAPQIVDSALKALRHNSAGVEEAGARA